MLQANDDDGTKYLCSKAQLIDELEASLPGWVRRPSWYPQFVHLLKVHLLQPPLMGNLTCNPP